MQPTAQWRKLMESRISKEEFNYRLTRLQEAVDAEQLLRLLGFQITRVTEREVRAPCAVHGGDNKTAFRMNKDTKRWVCFSHQCHEDIGFGVIDLVKHMLNMNFAEAVKYLESITGIDIHDESDYVEYQRQKERQEVIHQADNRKIPPALIDESFLKSFGKFRSDYFEHEENGGFSKELLDLFEIGGGYVDKFGFQRDVIPIRDVNGRLLAYSARDITGKADYDYKYLLTEGFDKDKVLYNLFRAKDYMNESRVLIVVEGFKSIWNLYRAGYKNSVACMGSVITSGQQNLLYKHAFKIVTLFDGDEAGVKGTLRALNDMKGKIDIIPLFMPYTGKDPGDLTVDELHGILRR